MREAYVPGVGSGGVVNLQPEQLVAQVDRLVIGSDFGADGYTTVEQADELASRLELRPGLRLLDLGCGRGWPGLYLAMRTGCQVVLSDVPLDGLRSANARAVRERLDARCAVVAASGSHLPFAGESFDAIVHTDVLC
jgi:ubiquinone/menaquinone biosynthesis C-methylase UbiE